jgi:cytochrome c biogenesis protein CcdA
MLSKGRRRYVATLCERFATVAFASAFASAFFAQIPHWPKILIIAGTVAVILLGVWVSPADGGKDD